MPETKNHSPICRIEFEEEMNAAREHIMGRRVVGDFEKPPEHKEETPAVPKKKFKTAKDYGFHAMLNEGASKEELMNHFCIDEGYYRRVIKNLLDMGTLKESDLKENQKP